MNPSDHWHRLGIIAGCVGLVGAGGAVAGFIAAVFGARLRADLGRRTAQLLRVGVLVVGARARRCLGRGQHSELGPKEFNPVVAQGHLAGRVVSRNRLMAQVWDEKWFDSTKTLDVPMAALRPRIEAAEQRLVLDGAPGGSSTLRGFGYRLEVSRGAREEP